MADIETTLQGPKFEWSNGSVGNPGSNQSNSNLAPSSGPPQSANNLGTQHQNTIFAYAYYGKLTELQALLDRRVDVNIYDRNGNIIKNK